MDKKELKKISNQLKPVFFIGKNDISDNFIKQLEDYLEVHSVVKIKVNIATSKDSCKEFAEKIANIISAQVIDIKGMTFTIHKETF